MYSYISNYIFTK